MAGSHAGDGRPTAWLSLDPSDNQAASFWPYLIAAAADGGARVRRDSLSLLESPKRTDRASFATLLNELSALANDLVLVLDDYHVIDATRSMTAWRSCWTTCPAQIHLVIATRADPPLPLARLRARGELVEIRAADLRFTPDEASAYLNEVMGLDLGASEVVALEARTEGLDRRSPAGGALDPGP